MHRRKFLHLSAGSAAMLMLSSFLESCKKAGLFDDVSYRGKVIVVGAGAAGLYAAHLLKLQGVDVQILEAKDKAGGRIKSLSDFSDFPIELGAEIIKGERSILYDLVRSSGATFTTQALTDYYYFNGNLKSQTEAEENTFFNVMMQLADSFENYTSGDVDAQTYADLNGISNNVEHIWNALIGNTRGTSAENLGLFGLRSEWEKWSSGEGRWMLKDRSLMDVLESTFSNITDNITFNTAVASIDYSAGKINITDANGNSYEADKVIITIPLAVLQQNAIQFNPPLPSEKITALGKIGMDRGIKIIFKFSERIWPEGARSVYGNGYIPEYRAISEGKSTAEYLLSAYVAGPKADELASLGESIVPTLLAELDDILGNATTYYLTHHLQDWGDEPFTRGAISYTPTGAGNAREIIAKPLNNKIYFAGEATHTGSHHGTVHGAMETALRAVQEILVA